MMNRLLSDLDSLLITNPTNIRYLTGFVGAAPDEREAYVLLTANQCYLFTNSLYIESAKKLSNQLINQSSNQLMIIEVSREEPLSTKLVQITQKLRIKKLGFEDVDLTVAEYQKLKQELNNVELIPTRDRVEIVRMIKRDDEIAAIRAAAKLTDQCFNVILGQIKPGVTEMEIAWEIETFFKKHGAGNAFSPIVAFGKNSSQPHYAPSSSKLSVKEPQSLALKNQDIVLLDFGARVNGYCSDMTRVVFVGKPKDEWKQAYQTVLTAQDAAIQQLEQCYHVTEHDSKKEVSISGAGLDLAARSVISKAGFPVYPHSLGHAVGLAIHEAPRLSVKKDAVLKPGMVVTIEPGIYVEGSYGIRIEDLVLLKPDSIELLSTSKKELTIV